MLDTIQIDKIPSVNKEMIQENYDDVLTVPDITRKELLDFVTHSTIREELFKGKYHILHTSGSSGNVGIFSYNEKEFIRGCSSVTRTLNFSLAGRCRLVGVLPFQKPHGASIESFTSMCRSLKWIGFKSLSIDIAKPWETNMKKLRSFSPISILTYPSALNHIIEYAKQNPLENKFLQIRCGGEPCSESLKKDSRKYLGVEPYNLYASTEFLHLAIMYPGDNFFCVNDENVLIEIIEEKVYITSLYNYTQPLIRYEVSDKLQLINKKKRFHPFTKIGPISGRIEDEIILEHGQNKLAHISPSLFASIVVTGISLFQIVNLNKKKIIIHAKVATGLNPETPLKELKGQIQKILKDKGISDFPIEVLEDKNLAIDPKTGKFKMIINK